MSLIQVASFTKFDSELYENIVIATAEVERIVIENNRFGILTE